MVAALLAFWAGAAPAGPAQHPAVDTALQNVRDSLDRVRGATFNFRTDLSGASVVVLRQRAQRVHASCVAAGRALDRLDSILTASYPGGAPAALRRENRALRAALTTCRTEYDTGPRWGQRADSVRAWAPYRLARLDEAALRYAQAAKVPRARRP